MTSVYFRYGHGRLHISWRPIKTRLSFSLRSGWVAGVANFGGAAEKGRGGEEEEDVGEAEAPDEAEEAAEGVDDNAKKRDYFSARLCEL